MTSETKQCTKCGETKPITQFRLRYKNKPGRRGQCNKCETARKKNSPGHETYMKEYLKEYRKQYRVVLETPEYKEKANNKAKAVRIVRRRQYELGEVAPPNMKTCGNCGKTKIKELFGLNFNSHDLLSTYCKQCRHKMYLEYKRRKERATG